MGPPGTPEHRALPGRCCGPRRDGKGPLRSPGARAPTWPAVPPPLAGLRLRERGLPSPHRPPRVRDGLGKSKQAGGAGAPLLGCACGQGRCDRHRPRRGGSGPALRLTSWPRRQQWTGEGSALPPPARGLSGERRCQPRRAAPPEHPRPSPLYPAEGAGPGLPRRPPPVLHAPGREAAGRAAAPYHAVPCRAAEAPVHPLASPVQHFPDPLAHAGGGRGDAAPAAAAAALRRQVLDGGHDMAGLRRVVRRRRRLRRRGVAVVAVALGGEHRGGAAPQRRAGRIPAGGRRALLPPALAPSASGQRQTLARSSLTGLPCSEGRAAAASECRSRSTKWQQFGDPPPPHTPCAQPVPPPGGAATAALPRSLLFPARRRPAHLHSARV